jgi:hypothetical protein
MTVFDIQRATIRARSRLGGTLTDKGLISVAVEQGKGQIRRVRKLAGGDSEFTAITGWMPVAEIPNALEEL